MATLPDEMKTQWDNFLRRWPADKLATMTLDDYIKPVSKDSFANWLEQHTKALGGIGGASAFKFGVYLRKHKEPKEENPLYTWTEEAAWVSSLGKSSEEVFSRVRGEICDILREVQDRRLERLDDIKSLAAMVCWKIAFLYQDRERPLVVDVYKKDVIARYLGVSADLPMSKLQRLAMERKPDSLEVFSYGRLIWEKGQPNNEATTPLIFKLSHGNSPKELKDLRDKLRREGVATLHGETKKGQTQAFQNAKQHTLFFLCHGSVPELIGRFTGGCVLNPDMPGWLARPYELVCPCAKQTGPLPDEPQHRAWMPDANSTFSAVPHAQLAEFERQVLAPYFHMSLAELKELVARSSFEAQVEESEGDGEASSFQVIEPLANAVNKIYYGPPGTGKTWALQNLMATDYTDDIASVAPVLTQDADIRVTVYGAEDLKAANRQKRFEWVTFHQSYNYEDFVEGIRPVVNKRNDGAGRGEIQYQVVDGIFKALCERARLRPHERFAICIDELNRGNVSKIFGELLTLIEVGKRAQNAEKKEALAVRLSCSQQLFTVPPNLDIYATMNTADRSLTTLDAALRRRFDMVAFYPDTRAVANKERPEEAPLQGIEAESQGYKVVVAKMLEVINKRIEALYDRDHTLGHAYFTELRSYKGRPAEEFFASLAKIMLRQVVPLLEDYFFNEWEKITFILGGQKKKGKKSYFWRRSTVKVPADKSFASMDGDEEGQVFLYRLEEKDFLDPAAYYAVYNEEEATEP